jgi:ABC-2 type transport system permease protein
MFWKIFIFELQNKLRRPAVYVYFAAAFLFMLFTFTAGALPVGEKEHINSPRLIAFVMGWISIIMMLVTSAIMGMPLYKDIEYNTKDYYLTYPITKFGYFWGRYFSSLLFVLVIGSGVMFGAFAGTKIGPLMGFNIAARYGPNSLKYYLQPFLMIGIPNLVFTSSVFYGLVAITRNIKVIYSSGIVLFLGYLIATFFLAHTNNHDVINLADPFAFSGIRMQFQDVNDELRNVTMMAFSGSLLLNRIIWPLLGIAVLVFTYIRFNFEDFFSGKRDKSSVKDEQKTNRNAIRPQVATSFAGSYNIKTILSLTKTELLNIIRDNYFWIIMSCGLLFLGFVFYMGNEHNYGVDDFPRTVTLIAIFNEVFLFFIFFIIIFYTGETVHRDRITRYAFINDSLPAPNWVLNGSKLLSLLVLGFGLSLIPMVLGVLVQLIKGYTDLNLPVYLMTVFTLVLPRFLEMVVFSYVIHVVVNNKFAAHGIGIVIWVVMFFMNITSIFNYRPLLYSYTPGYEISDMDGIGHMAGAVAWFNLYWLLAAGLLIIIAALFYYRGISSTFKERWQLVKERFDNGTRIIAGVLLVCFLAVGSFIYYNVSYLNSYTTNSENIQRAVLYERTLKPYDKLPLPKVSAMKLAVDLFPDQQRAQTHGFITLINKTNKPINKMLLDADGVTEYTLKTGGKEIPFTSPLIYSRGKLDFFRPKQDTSDFRLYQFNKALAPGDSIVVEINSAVFYTGFSNDLFSANILRNGTFYKGGLPGLGYDDDDELGSPYERKQNHLSPKTEEEVAQNDPEGINRLKAGKPAMLAKMDLTVSTSGDQTALAPGALQKKWTSNGRNYFHYVQDKPGMYPPFGFISARYAVLHSDVKIDSGKSVNVNIYYHPEHKANINRFMNAFKDGLSYFSKVYGNYPFKDLSLAETSIYGPGSSSATSLDTYKEKLGWNADFKSPDQFDYCYYMATQQLAQQWWRFQVAPNNTVGSLVIPEGLAKYESYVMAEKHYGKNNIRGLLVDQMWGYLYLHSRTEEAEHPLIKANEWFEWENKAGTVLYGLRDLIGDDNMNSALREFKQDYAFKKEPPYAGSNDLYRYLKKHTPDSLQYYLTDTWEKITFYDNRVVSAKSVAVSNNKYKVTLNVSTGKSYIQGKGNYVDAPMNDYIDIAVFAAQTKDKEGRQQVNPLYIKKHKLTAGKHTIEIIVHGKPVSVGIDPYDKLVDKMPNDNLKDL